MNKLKFILLFALSVVVLSCSDDDDSSGPELTTANITGTYNLTFFEATTVESEIINAGTVVTTIETEGDTFGESNIVFNSDGTFVTNFQYRITETTSSTIEDSETTVETEIITESNTGTYSVNEEDQTITFNGEIGDVTRFNDEELRIESTFNGELANGTFTDETEIRFERQ